MLDAGCSRSRGRKRSNGVRRISEKARIVAENIDLKAENARLQRLLGEAFDHLRSNLGAVAKRHLVGRIRNELQWAYGSEKALRFATMFPG